MMNKDWWKSSVVYQVYPQSFNDTNNDGVGDLKGITEKLPYLSKLGIDVIWLNPIYESPLVDNGYDIANYRKINPMYGTMEDFDELLETAHSMNIKIIMDLVVNHTSDQHEWFLKSKSSKDNEYCDFYIWKDPKEDCQQTGVLLLVVLHGLMYLKENNTIFIALRQDSLT